MIRFDAKRISDPVHKTIGLSNLEVRVIGTPAFQRLRNVKQLGLADYVFPGASYPRLAHSLGVCHITGRIIDAIADYSGQEIPDAEKQLYRLAGLLHDVGHYPYSHAMEEAVEDYYSGSLLEDGSSGGKGEGAAKPEAVVDGERFFRHERVGKEVLTKDPELEEILSAADINPEQVYSTFTREEPPRFANLISSDLDADRIDYLLRTAHYTGLPYGSVDIDYLLSQVRVDVDNRICVTPRALRTADHFLLSRYFDYQQVPFHKTVAALEAVLKDVITALLREGKIDCSARRVSDAISNGTWREFDDGFILHKIRSLYEDTADDIDRLRAQSILNRVPPKLVASTEWIGPRDDTTARNFRLQKRLVRDNEAKWASKFGIDENLWYVWDLPGMVLTKVGSHVPVSALRDRRADDEDEYEQAVRVLGSVGNGSKNIMELDSSLMSVLANHALYALRVYVLFPPGTEEKHRSEIEETIRKDLAEISWG